MKVAMDKRYCAVLLRNDIEVLGIFHKWTEKYEEEEGTVDCALVEMADGTMQCVNAQSIRFLNFGDEMCPKLLEAQLNEAGVLNGDD